MISLFRPSRRTQARRSFAMAFSDSIMRMYEDAMNHQMVSILQARPDPSDRVLVIDPSRGGDRTAVVITSRHFGTGVIIEEMRDVQREAEPSPVMMDLLLFGNALMTIHGEHVPLRPSKFDAPVKPLEREPPPKPKRPPQASNPHSIRSPRASSRNETGRWGLGRGAPWKFR